MGRYNNGIIITNSNCIACNKCVATCPVVGANVSVGNSNNTKILVDAKKCTHCGQCITACAHEAREYKDDIDNFITDLRVGVKMSVIIDTSFFLYYGEYAYKVLGYLKEMGVEHFYDTSFGAEISYWGHSKYLKDNADKPTSERAFIINSCPSVIDAIELYHPTLLKKIIPVQSPTLCTAVYVRKYLKDENVLAYFGPCISKKDEFASTLSYTEIKHCVSFEHLMEHMRNKDLEQYNCVPELRGMGMGELAANAGVFAEGMELFFSPYEMINVYTDMSEETFKKLELVCTPGYEVMQPLAAEVIACKNGCLEGPGMAKEDYNAVDIYSRYAEIRNKDYADGEALATERDKIWEYADMHVREVLHIHYEDFVREYSDRYKQPFTIPQNTYDEIFFSMFKDTAQKQNLNCGSCGYSTCREMVSAIAYGYNRKENCIHYMNDVMMQRYMYNPVTDLYNQEYFTKQTIEIMKENPDKKYFILGGNVNKLRIVNDVYGYDVGDVVLKVIAAQLESLAIPDGICGYFGGGNFVVFAEYTPSYIERFQSVRTFDMSDLGIQHIVTMRFGIYIIEDINESMTSVINYAFMASKENISSIQNTYTYFSKETRNKISFETDMVARIQKALDDREFSLMYRPQYDLNTRSIVGAEGRCCWAEEGVVHEYSLYLGIAERNGLIKYIDVEIWTKAFAAVRRWLDAGIEPPVLVLSMSMLSVEAEDTIETIAKLRDEYKVSNHYIRFEVSEASYGYDPVVFARRATFLRKTGYQIEIRDFGCGQSSLSALTANVVDIIKIDMNFLQNETNKDKGGAIITAIARMTQDLGILAEADNVETESQASFLKSVGIYIGQGTLFSEDLAEHDYINLVKNTEATTYIEKKTVTGKIDIGRFYDPTSYESIMFENFSGPAAIIEFDESEKSLEIVRMNTEATKMMGCESKPIAEIQTLFSDYVRGRGKGVSEHLKFDNKEGTSYVLAIHEQKYYSEKWIKINIWEISVVDDRHSLFLQFEDVTSDQVIDGALNLSNYQMAYLTESKACGSCIVHANILENHLNDNLKLTIIRANAEFCNLTGYGPAEILGWTEKDIWNGVHPLDRQGLIETIRKTLIDEMQTTYSGVFRSQNKSGYYKKLRMIVTALPMSDGSFLAYVNIVSAEES